MLMKTTACKKTETEIQYSEKDAVSSHKEPTLTTHYKVISYNNDGKHN